MLGLALLFISVYIAGTQKKYLRVEEEYVRYGYLISRHNYLQNGSCPYLLGPRDHVANWVRLYLPGHQEKFRTPFIGPHWLRNFHRQSSPYVAFAFNTAGGVLLAKFLNLFLKEKINPLIGSAGVSAVPMSARVSQRIGQQEDPKNFLLMHAMGPNVAGVIGTAAAAGLFLTRLQ